MPLSRKAASAKSNVLKNVVVLVARSLAEVYQVPSKKIASHFFVSASFAVAMSCSEIVFYNAYYSLVLSFLFVPLYWRVTCRSKPELLGLLDCSIALKKAFKDPASGIEVRNACMVTSIFMPLPWLHLCSSAAARPYAIPGTNQRTQGTRVSRALSDHPCPSFTEFVARLVRLAAAWALSTLHAV